MTKAMMGSKIGITSTFFLTSDGENIYSIFSKDKESYKNKVRLLKLIKIVKTKISNQWIFDKKPIAESESLSKNRQCEYYTAEIIEDDLTRKRTLWSKTTMGTTKKYFIRMQIYISYLLLKTNYIGIK